MPNPYTVTDGGVPGVPLLSVDTAGNLAIAGELTPGALASPDGGHLLNNGPVVQIASLTATGTTAAVAVLPGPLVTPSAGQAWRFEAWGVITTTAETQTVTSGLYVGGVNGTAIITATTTPNSSGTLTNATVYFTGSVVFTGPAAVQGAYQADYNYFPSTVNQGSAVCAATAGQQLVFAVANSATAVSLTISAGYWQKIA
jgi:hypothetical protein